MEEKLINEKFKNHHEKRITDLERTYVIMQKMDDRISNIDKAVEKIDKKLSEKESEKGKKWDKLIDYLFYFIIATILGFLAVKLNLK